MTKQKKENDYSLSIGSDLYSECPKAVFAAIVVSLMVNHGGHRFNELGLALLKEWYLLHMQGIIPQCPPKKLWQIYGNGKPQ